MEQHKRYRATGLAQTLQEQGRHQRWLARKLGVHESMVSRIVAGERPASEMQAQRISELLMVPLFLLFELTNVSNKHTERIPA